MPVAGSWVTKIVTERQRVRYVAPENDAAMSNNTARSMINSYISYTYINDKLLAQRLLYFCHRPRPLSNSFLVSILRSKHA